MSFQKLERAKIGPCGPDHHGKRHILKKNDTLKNV